MNKKTNKEERNKKIIELVIERREKFPKGNYPDEYSNVQISKKAGVTEATVRVVIDQYESLKDKLYQQFSDGTWVELTQKQAGIGIGSVGRVIERDRNNGKIKLKLLPSYSKLNQEIWVFPQRIKSFNAEISKSSGLKSFKPSKLKSWKKAVSRKKQVILCGSPGTGKSYLAAELANSLVNYNTENIEIIQFHPAYTYEDFVQGIRPVTNKEGGLSYKLVSGRFLNFCEKARKTDEICVLIIDEINRANLSHVFGELMYLLEYRDAEIKLAGSDKPFSIPENVRIIGTMNTADRSIALIDHALRRRFAFIRIDPNYDVVRQYHDYHETGCDVEGLVEVLQDINQAIGDRNYELGISYFLTETLEDDIADIWEMEIEPYLEEHFFDNPDRVEEFRWEKVKDRIGIANSETP
ncbi:AAA family ATPase [Geitlerinema sp. CS-897]|nr:AAA family ATPase [Geitlerinema sp. CS-897]